MTSPPKQKRVPPKNPLRNPQLLSAGYRLLGFLQGPFGFIFWFIQQHKAWLQDQLANEGHDV